MKAPSFFHPARNYSITLWLIATVLIGFGIFQGCKQKEPKPPTLALVDNIIQLDFGPQNTHQSFGVKNVGEGELTWTVSANQSWIKIYPATGTGNHTIDVEIDKTELEAGQQTGIITVSSNGGTKTFQLSTTVSSPIITISVSSLNFNVNTPNQFVAVKNSGAGVLRWSVSSNHSWINVPTGTYTQNTASGFDATVKLSGLTAGTHSATLVISSNDKNINLPVTLTVASPILNVNPDFINFGNVTRVTAAKISLDNYGQGILTWNAASNANWLTVSSTSGDKPTSLDVIVNPAGLSTGNYNGAVTFNSSGGTKTVPVNMTVASSSSGSDSGSGTATCDFTTWNKLAEITRYEYKTTGGCSSGITYLSLKNNATVLMDAKFCMLQPDGKWSCGVDINVKPGGLFANNYWICGKSQALKIWAKPSSVGSKCPFPNP